MFALNLEREWRETWWVMLMYASRECLVAVRNILTCTLDFFLFGKNEWTRNDYSRFDYLLSSLNNRTKSLQCNTHTQNKKLARNSNIKCAWTYIICLYVVTYHLLCVHVCLFIQLTVDLMDSDISNFEFNGQIITIKCHADKQVYHIHKSCTRSMFMFWLCHVVFVSSFCSFPNKFASCH